MRTKTGIIGPDLKQLGGVSNFYNVILGHLSDAKYLGVYGSFKSFGFAGIFRILKFIGSSDIVILNPSLQYKALLRDFVYILTCRILGKPVLCLIHGWDVSVQKTFDRYPVLFRCFSYSIDSIGVLSKDFRDKVRLWAPEQRVELFKTHVDDYFFDMPIRDSQKNLYFLSRITREKGIFEVLEVHHHLHRMDSEFQLFIIGDGDALEEAIRKVKSDGIGNVNFTGRLSHKETLDIFGLGGQLLFPTRHGEGLPTVVLEALASGLLVYTNPIGGINDIKDSIPGLFMIDELSLKQIAKLIAHNLSDANYQSITRQSKEVVYREFNTSLVGNEIEKLVNSILSE